MEETILLSLPLGVVALGFLAIAAGIAFSTTHVIRRRTALLGIASAGPILGQIVRTVRFPALLVSPKGDVLDATPDSTEWFGTGGMKRISGTLATLVAHAAAARAPQWARLPPGSPPGAASVEAIPFPSGSGDSLVLLIGNPLPDAQQRISSYARLLGALAHEVRTPLTAVLGHVENLEAMGPEDEELRHRSQRFISEQASRLAHLVEDLARLSRLDAVPMNLRPLNLRSELENALAAVESAAQHKRIQILIQAPPSLPRVRADGDRIQQVLINLLDNAVKYTPPDGTIVVSLSEISDAVGVEVLDSGPGIPPEEQPHVFEPFFRGSRPEFKAMPGTGLGLTIARMILLQHGADIRISSTSGGSSFSFSLAAAI